jgi:FkbM family methyltransferase
MAIKNLIHSLPVPLLRKLRFVRDQIAIRTYRPKIADHIYGGIRLRVKIEDKMSARWYDRDFEELPEITFLKQQRLKPGALVFDLGAHQGVIALLLARIVGPSGRVIAVEAGTYNFEIAHQNKALNEANNLSIIQAAVARQSGITMSFTGGINGTVSPSGELVLSTSIDALAAEHGNPDVVMLDVEGSENTALEGATETLKSGANWYLEVHAGCGLEELGGSSQRMAQLFENHGYSLYCQTDEHYKHEFRPMSIVPAGRFFMIAIKK